MIAIPARAGIRNSAYRSAPAHKIINWKQSEKTMAETKSNSNNFIFGLIGLVLGLVVGYMLTTSINKQPKGQQQAKAGPVQGSEKLPAGHPDVSKTDIDKEVAAA